jgi:hypothetical protein
MMLAVRIQKDDDLSLRLADSRLDRSAVAPSLRMAKDFCILVFGDGAVASSEPSSITRISRG